LFDISKKKTICLSGPGLNFDVGMAGSPPSHKASEGGERQISGWEVGKQLDLLSDHEIYFMVLTPEMIAELTLELSMRMDPNSLRSGPS
jgi:hypothetical protein